MTDWTQITRTHSLDCEELLRSYRPLAITYAPGEMICQAESYIAGIHLIMQGIVADTMVSISEDPRVTQILIPGDWIGVEILDCSTSRTATSLCRAVTRVELLFVERQQMLAALEDHVSLRQLLVGYLVSRLVFERNGSQDKASLEVRMARLLIQIGQVCGTPTGNGFIALPPEITPRLLADLLRISPRQMRQVRQSIDSLDLGGSGMMFADQAVRCVADGNDVGKY